MSTLFISDLHLSAERPGITGLFIDFLNTRAREARALYILGDLFEVWLGDDLVLPDYQPAIDALRQLSAAGVDVYIMYGNRDFLMRDAFEHMTGAALLADECIMDLYGTPTLLLHGDTLCTDDVKYQQFRHMVRQPQWQDELLARSPEERLALAKQYRDMSQNETAGKQSEIMDVNQEAVQSAMRLANVTQLIHGHTHRPDTHHFELDGQAATRIVLGDWYHTGDVLICDEHGCQRKILN
ncbi:MAG: UDP-2,3-diacylglucosamine diphosphatase [Gammaproteobacteria bacterium]